MQRRTCPNCGKYLIDPMGNPNSPYLLVGEYPGKLEVRDGLPVAFGKDGRLASGDILQNELTRVGIMMREVLVTNLWQHSVPVSFKSKKKVEGGDIDECPLEWHIDELVKLFAGRTHILLMGSEVTQALLGVSAMEVSGTRVKVPALGKSKIHYWVSPSISTVYGQPVGELRLAFERFAADIKKGKK